LFFLACPHCAKVKPHYAGAGEELAEKGSKVKLAAIEFGMFPGVNATKS